MTILIILFDQMNLSRFSLWSDWLQRCLPDKGESLLTECVQDITKYKSRIMVLACFNADMVEEIVRIPAGSKINGDIYLKILQSELVPSIRIWVDIGLPTQWKTKSIKPICLENRMLSTISITWIYNEFTDRQISISFVQKILKKCGWNSYMAKNKPY